MDFTRRELGLAALAASAAVPVSRTFAATAHNVRIGQATATLGFLPIWAARTFDTFAAQNTTLNWALINGGDPACLAALDSGDIDLAATGSDSVLDAAAKGLPYQIVYSLMSKMSLVLTVSEALIKRTGVSKDQPVVERIASLKGATVGVAAIGGAQDRTVRWLVTKAGLDPRKDIQIAQIGSSTALGAALENGRIDAFMLSPPEGQIAEMGHYGRVLIDPNTDIPGLHGMPSLVLVARSNADEAARQRIIASLRALNAGSRALLADPDAGADKIGAKFYPKLPNSLMRASVAALTDGIRDDGLLNDERAQILIDFLISSGRAPPKSASFWTNRYVEDAKAS